MDVRYPCGDLTFVWDEHKATRNLQKHGVTFEEACTAFFDPYAAFIDASVITEVRSAIIGKVRSEKLLYIVHLERERNSYRIISARQAEVKERRLYEEGSDEDF